MPSVPHGAALRAYTQISAARALISVISQHTGKKREGCKHRSHAFLALPLRLASYLSPLQDAGCHP